MLFVVCIWNFACERVRIMKLANRVARALGCLMFAVIVFAFYSVSAFAVSVDGIISPDEMNGCNIEVQCTNENSGNGVCTLVTYFALQEDGSLYVALNTDFSKITITEESPVAFEIMLDDNPPIKIDILGNAEYDEQLFAVKNKVNFTDSGASCEAIINLKYRHDEVPEIQVRVIDDEGVPSKLFAIDTSTTATTDKSDDGSSSKSQSSSKSNPSKSSSSKKSKTSSSKKNSSTKTSDKSTADSTSVNYDVPQETYTLPSDMPTGTQMLSFSDAVKILCAVIIIALILSCALAVFFKIRQKEIEAKKKAKEEKEKAKAERKKKSADKNKKK